MLVPAVKIGRKRDAIQPFPRSSLPATASHKQKNDGRAILWGLRITPMESEWKSHKARQSLTQLKRKAIARALPDVLGREYPVSAKYKRVSRCNLGSLMYGEAKRAQRMGVAHPDEIEQMGVRGSPMMSGDWWWYRGRHNCHYGAWSSQKHAEMVTKFDQMPGDWRSRGR